MVAQSACLTILRSAVGKGEEKFSLKTREPAEAKRLHAAALVALDDRWGKSLAPYQRCLKMKGPPGIGGKWHPVRRWAPLLCAYSGARLSESLPAPGRGYFSTRRSLAHEIRSRGGIAQK